MEFKEGYYENIPYEEYANIGGYRSHDLSSFIRCPYTWKHSKGLTQSPALLEGRVQHTVFLEHHNFDKEFIIEPKIDKRTKAGKEERSKVAHLSLKICMTLAWREEKLLKTLSPNLNTK
jgi:hypothetical protein